MNKKDDIYKAALTLLVEQGEQSSSMKLVAKHAKCGIGTMYNYFTSKDELISELYVKLKTELFVAILEGHNPNLPVKEQFTKAWIQAIVYAVNNPTEYKYIDMFAHSSKISKQAEEKINKLIYPIVEIYERGKREGIIKNFDTANLIFFTTGGITGSILNKSDISKKEIKAIIMMAWDAIKS